MFAQKDRKNMIRARYSGLKKNLANFFFEITFEVNIINSKETIKMRISE